MNTRISIVVGALAAAAWFVPAQALAQGNVSFTLKYGVLAGLTGDPAPSGQGWNEAARLGVNYATETLKQLNLPNIKIVLADSQDSQGNAQAGVEAAQKLVNIDKVNVIIGDFYSSVTSAAATAVAIPNQVVMFTGGTSPALSKLNTGPVALIWQPVAADDLQGRVLAQVIAERWARPPRSTSPRATTRYGTNLSNAFKEAWLAGGGTIPEMVIYNHQQPTLDSEAQRVVAGQSRRLALHRFLPDLREAGAAVDAHRQVGSGQELRLRHAERLREQRLAELSRDARDAGQRVVGLVVPGVQGAVREERQAGRQVPVVHRRVVRLACSSRSSRRSRRSPPIRSSSPSTSSTSPTIRARDTRSSSSTRRSRRCSRARRSISTARPADQLRGQRPDHRDELRHLAAQAGRQPRRWSRPSRSSPSARPFV